MAFNKTNVQTFQDKLEEVLLRHENFRNGSRVYNLDETNTSTVGNSLKVISPKGVKQIHQVKGSERGVSVTTCVIIGAYGIVLPPILIFPQKKFIPVLMINAFPGSLGLANEKGYMIKKIFSSVMKHFIKCVGASKENPALLLLESHFSIETLDIAKENDVVIFTFPPHCTHKLQPLVGFFSPFKTYYNAAVNSFLTSHPATPPSIYHIAGFVNKTICKAATPNTIIKSFEVTGIYPFNRNVFQDSYFVMATVTEAPPPPAENENSAELATETLFAEKENSAETANKIKLCINTNNAPENANTTGSLTEESVFISSVQIRGFPKKKTDNKRKPRKKGKCMVATDTPEKSTIAEHEKEQKLKKQKIEEKKRQRQEKQDQVNKKQALTYKSDSSGTADDVAKTQVREETKKRQYKAKKIDGKKRKAVRKVLYL